MDKSCRCKLIKAEDTVKQEVEGIKKEYIGYESTSCSLRRLGRSFYSIISNIYFFITNSLFNNVHS